MLLPGRNKVDGWIQPLGLVFATCVLRGGVKNMVRFIMQYLTGQISYL